MTNPQANAVPTVGELGEQGILDAMLPLLDSRKASLGPGDDAGAMWVSGPEVVVSVDTLVENQDFRLNVRPPEPRPYVILTVQVLPTVTGQDTWRYYCRIH